jgi:hypothetical protein
MVMVPASLAGRDDFYIGVPATSWLANIQLSLRDENPDRQNPVGVLGL